VPREYQAAARRFNRYDSKSKIRRLAALEFRREFWKPDSPAELPSSSGTHILRPRTRRISNSVTVPSYLAACGLDVFARPRHCVRRIFEELLVSNEATISSCKLALACADFLWSEDATLRSLGLERLSIKPGHAKVAMTVLPAMVNGIGITHGGAIFTLADTTFSLASNSYNERTVAAHCCISYLQPTRLGDRLVATATQIVRSARSGIYDVSVTLENTVIAEFRAHSRVVGGALLPAAPAGQSRPAAESVNQ
jgi:acyl-CoA thioesterase